ncbi:MAG TPA: glycosyltransferase [Candidatus Accumulibacter phosphatis]|nr:glycosyltransferase [Candidatus Accumulibacter phosphatis]HRQ96535.1 glycosyltransferase [Candidatus Accumulibacter phosphatis]
MTAVPDILFLQATGDLGGVEQVTRSLIAALARRGVRSQVAILFSDSFGYAQKHSGQYVFVGNGGQSMTINSLIAARRLLPLARRCRAIVATSPMTIVAAMLLSRLSGTPCAAWMHYDSAGIEHEFPEGMDLRARLVFNVVAPAVRRACFVSADCASRFRQKHGLQEAARDYVSIPNPFAVTGAIDERAPGAEVRLLFIGRFCRAKQPEQAVLFAAELARLHQNFRLDLIGDGELRPLVEATIRAHPDVERHVCLLGAIPDAANRIAEYDALILTSGNEAWPTVALEALSRHRPVFAFCCTPGPAEILAHGGGEVSESTPAALAGRVSNAVFRREFQADWAATDRFIARHDPDAVAAQWQRWLFGEAVA